MHVCRWENPGISGDPVTCLCRTIKPAFHRAGMQAQSILLSSFYLTQNLILLKVWWTARHPHAEGFLSPWAGSLHSLTMLKIFGFFPPHSWKHSSACLDLILRKQRQEEQEFKATQLVQTKPELYETLPEKKWKLKQNKSKASFLYQTRGPAICQPKMHVLYEDINSQAIISPTRSFLPFRMLPSKPASVSSVWYSAGSWVLC